MTVTASAYVTPEYSGVIKLENSEPWPTTAWSITVVAPEVFLASPLLYSQNYSGTGSLSGDGKVITVIIPRVPHMEFVLTIGAFAKIFNLWEDNEWPDLHLVAAGPLKWSPSTVIQPAVAGPNFVLFSNQDLPVIGGKIVADLVQEDLVVGYCVGTPFKRVKRSDTAAMWPRGGYIFTQYFWQPGYSPTATAETYLMVIRGAGSRGGSSFNMEVNVTMSDTQAFTPTDNLFQVHTEDVFYLDGTLL